MPTGVIEQMLWPYSIFMILLFIAGLYCILVSANLIRILIGTEILIKAVTLLLILAGYLNGNSGTAQALVITLIVVEVVLMVVAGGIVLNVFRHTRSISTTALTEMKG